ncbi:hypothetical protein EV143_10928 [Flavobacterium chryseum]|uniref:hypothetical protein n=1 Tax=Flavobacterium sp. P3160 TaxID=2512113 RepID=UPI0010601CB0|nr:hypothetical protein [Flavobacterium sp. P3160]TDO71173.1 hypothetical protein EV143_10928 [Flavobacterium sp. P3160]
MKKITLLLILLLGVSSYSQEKKFFQSPPEKLTVLQQAFMVMVGVNYPEFSRPASIVNIYDDKKQIAESYLEYQKPPNECDDYLIVMQSDSKRLDYELNYGARNGNLTVKGSIYLVDSNVYKLEISTKGKSKNFVQLYKNGKEVYSENPYKGLN